MKPLLKMLPVLVLAFMISCNQNSGTKPHNDANHTHTTTGAGGQENVKDDYSQEDVVKVATDSKDHTTLVATLKQSELATSLSNAGSFTVFAPVDATFDKLPAGTVDGLMKDVSIFKSEF